MAVSLFISTPIQYVPVSVINWGARYGWSITREAIKGTESTKVLEKIERAVQTPSFNTHDARRNSALEALTMNWFQGRVLSHIHSMRRDGNEPNDLQLKTRNMSTMIINGCEGEMVSISMDDRQRSPILDELSA